MEEKNTQADRAAAIASKVKKTMGNVGGLAYELNRAEFGINSAIIRCKALHLVDIEAELAQVAQRLNRITAGLQPAIFVEPLPVSDPDA